MTKVIAIRGTNGSGKTYVARKIMDAAEADFKTKFKLENGVIVNVFKNFVIPGSYDRVCGGCDTIKTPQLVWDTVVECAEHSNVVYEGVIVGNVYQPVIDLNERLKVVGAKLILLCLNTEFDQAVVNVNNRRAEAGKSPMEDTENIMTNHKKHLSSCKKFHADGMNPHWVSTDEAVAIALKELGYA